jgi:hypothetical protein
LLAAYVANRRRIGPADVEEAWADLQQLPTPWSGSASSADNQVIEFGRLDETADETADETDAAEKEEAPQLRLAEGSDDTDDFAGPERQIANIKNLIAEAEDDFQPAGAIGPEIELAFAETEDPFQEEFAEEERVADRYAASATVAVPPSPALPGELNSQVGQDAGNAYPAETTGKNAYPPGSVEIPGKDACLSDLADFLPAPQESLQESAVSPFSKEETWEIASSGGPNTPAAGNLPAVSAVIEKGPAEPVASPPHRADSSGRPREFRHLFAKLRHG